MSVINKKPFVQSALESLTAEQLGALKTIINSTSNSANFRSLINSLYAISTSDKGISRLVLEAKDKVYTGAWIYTDDYCVLLSWKSNVNQKMNIVKINPTKNSYELIEEKLSINELRRIVENLLLESGEGTDVAWGNIGGNIRNQVDLQAEFQNVREVAEGKCKTYVLSYADTLQSIKDDITDNDATVRDKEGNDITAEFLNGEYDVYFNGDSNHVYANPLFNSQNASLSLSSLDYATFVFRSIDTEFGGYYYVLDIEYIDGQSFKTGDVFLVIETDVPDRWVGGKWLFYKLETAKVDLSNYVDLSSNQTIPGEKTFENGVFLGGGTKIFNNGDRIAFYQGGEIRWIILADGTLRPYAGSDTDIATSAQPIRDITIRRYLKDTSGNSVTLAGISNGLFNVINASDIAANYILTDAQYNLFTNGRPVYIKGQVSSYMNGLFIVQSISDSQIAGAIYSGNKISSFYINIATKFLGFYSSTSGAFTLNTLYAINNKTIPAYPSSPANPKVLTYGTNDTMAWEDDGWNPASVSLSDGGTISDTTLQSLIQYHRPITLNGYTGYFSCDDGTNYQYHSIIYDSANNVNHLNVITINKNTWVVTFHTSNFALN